MSAEGKQWYQYIEESVTKVEVEAMVKEFLNIMDKVPSKLKKKVMSHRLEPNTADRTAIPYALDESQQQSMFDLPMKTDARSSTAAVFSISSHSSSSKHQSSSK
jgi:hypothetical protein